MWKNKDQRTANFVKSTHLGKTPTIVSMKQAQLTVFEYVGNKTLGQILTAGSLGTNEIQYIKNKWATFWT